MHRRLASSARARGPGPASCCSGSAAAGSAAPTSPSSRRPRAAPGGPRARGGGRGGRGRRRRPALRAGRPRRGGPPRPVLRLPLLPARQRLDVPALQGDQPRPGRLRRVRARARAERARTRPSALPAAMADEAASFTEPLALLPARGPARRHRGRATPRSWWGSGRSAASSSSSGPGRGRRGRGRRPAARAGARSAAARAPSCADDAAALDAAVARVSDGRGRRPWSSPRAAPPSCRRRPRACATAARSTTSRAARARACRCRSPTLYQRELTLTATYSSSPGRPGGGVRAPRPQGSVRVDGLAQPPGAARAARRGGRPDAAARGAEGLRHPARIAHEGAGLPRPRRPPLRGRCRCRSPGRARSCSGSRPR